jgi:DNA repair exonuclease SbcCD ATPase subunit
MKLRCIEGRNVKGRTFSHELSDAVAIIGPNFAGKSAIPDAIRLAFMGHLPEVGKLPKATWELSSGDRMSVVAHFDEERALTREFWLDGATVKTRLHTNDGKNSIGGDIDFESIPLLDAEHYFGLTDRQRTDYVFERIKLPDTYSSEAIVAGIEQISLGETHTEQVEKAKRALMVDVKKAFADNATIQDGLGQAVETFRQRFTYWNARARETQGAVITLTELKLRENEISAESMAAIQRDIDATARRKEELDTTKGSLTQKRDAAERTAGRRRQLQEALDAEPPDYAAMLKGKRREKEKLEAQVCTQPLKAEELDALRHDIRNTGDVARRAQTTFDRQGQIIKEAEAGLNELSALETCPYCKSKSKGWKSNLEKELTQRKTDALGLQEVAKKQITTAEGLVQKSTETLEAATAALEKNRTIREQIRELERSISTIENEQKAEAEKRDRWKAELTELPKPEDTKDLERQLTELHEQRVAVSQELSALTGKRDGARALAQDLKRAAQAQIEHEDANAYVVMVKAIATYLKEKRAKIVEEVFDKLLKVANRLCGEILMTPIALHDGTIGRWTEDKFIPHRVFSGTEKALAYIAIAIALSVEAPIRLVILDEFGRLDRDNQRLVVEILQEMVTDEVIDQFVVIGTDIFIEAASSGCGLQVIEVEP